MDEQQPEPWEMQSWDTTGSFRAFREFYLAQDAPRSVEEAYRRFRARRGVIETQAIRAPGRWQFWSRGYDADGMPIPGALSWKQRAGAWDQHLAEIATAEIEEAWRSKIMSGVEVLGRLSEQGRIDIGAFIVERDEPIRDEEGTPIRDKTGKVLTRAVLDIDLAMVKKYGHLIKSISSTRYGPKIELHDGQTALVQMGRHYKLFTDNFDLTTGGKPLQNMETLSDEQLRSAIEQLAKAGMAFAGGKHVPETTGDPTAGNPAGQGDEPADA